MAATASYGSVPLTANDEAPSRPRASACASIFKSLVTVVVLAAVLAFLIFEFGVAPVLTGLAVVLLVLYAVVFVAFCRAARLLVTSVFMVPVAALQMQLNMVSIMLAYVFRGFKPLYPEWNFGFEVMILAMRNAFDKFGEAIVFHQAPKLREPFANVGRGLLKANCAEHNTVPEEVHFNGLEHMWLRDPERANKQHRLVVIHYHGGGFATGHPFQDVELANITHSFLQEILADKYGLNVSVDVLLANYRKTPENPFPTPIDDGFAVYKHVLETEGVSPKQIVVGGESAGALMTLLNVMRMRNDSTPELQPLACLLYSPCVDFCVRGGDEETPHCFMPASFVDSANIKLLEMKTPEEQDRMSPVNSNLRDLPPIFLQYGTIERFADQCSRIAVKAQEQGVTNWKVDKMVNMPHAVVMLPSGVNPAVKVGIHHGCEFAAERAAKMFGANAQPAAAN